MTVLTTKDMIKEIQYRSQLKQGARTFNKYGLKEIHEIVQFYHEIAKDWLSHNKAYHVAGLWTLALKYRAPREGRNPRTGEEMFVSGKMVPTCKFHGSFKLKCYATTPATISKVVAKPTPKKQLAKAGKK